MEVALPRLFVPFAALFVLMGAPALASEPPTQTQATVAPSPAFSGTWVLDHSASDDITPVLKAQGVPWPQRSVAASLDVTLNLQDRGDRLLVETVTSMNTRNVELVLDGVERTRTEDKGQARVSSVRDAAGVISTTAHIQDGGKSRTLVVQRQLESGGSVLRQTLSVQPEKGSPVSATMVFRRGS